jgi:uncharacterized protein involved in outer membrane biogenesis
MFRRHPILCTLGLALAGLLAALAYLLLSFDLNQYRQQLELRLGQSLQRPVSLGAARLELWPVPTVEFAGLAIGPSKDSASTLEADMARLRLDWTALLQWRIALSQVLLDGARLDLVRQQGEAPSPFDPALLTRVGIDALTLQRGSVQLQDLRDPARPLSLQLAAIDGQIGPLAPGERVQLRLSGQLVQAEQPAPWSLSGSLELPVAPNAWAQTRVDLQGELQDLEATPLLHQALPQLKDLALQGRPRLEGRCQGELTTGLNLSLSANGEGLTFTAPPSVQHPRPFPDLQLQATWLPIGAAPQWRNLQLTAPTLGLNASAAWSEREGGPWLQVDLSSTPVPLGTWLSYLPDQPALPALAALRQSPPAGTVQLKALHYAGPPADLADPERFWPRLQGELSLREGEWVSSPWGEVRGMAAELRLEDGWLSIEQGRAQLLGGELTLSGRGRLPWRSESPIQGEARGRLEANRLLSLLPTDWAEGVVLEGPLDWQGRLSGTPEQLQLALEADLAPLALRRGELLVKTAGQAGRLQAEGKLTPARWELSSGRLELPLASLQLEGETSRTAPDRFRFAVRSEELDLAGLRVQHPLLEKLQLEGRAGVRLQWSATGEGRQFRGELALRRAGLQLGRLLAPLRQVQGRIRFDQHQASFEALKAQLGSSPIALEGRLDLGEHPELELELGAERLRADELIFPSPRAMLHQLHARLRIDRQGIDVTSARVRLEGGTEASLSGRIEDFAAPRVELEIEGDQVRIEEIIALWQRDPAAPKPVSVDRIRPEVRIRARARSGTLYGLPFTEAVGEIGLHEGILTIEPLSFHSGAGYCVGQVALDPRREGPALLKISGHAEELDAAAVYQQLLRRKGLVSGALRADVYLEGEVGQSFLATADGGASFSVDQGVLRKFPALGKVFSLLNVSQLLTLRLPDMATEGMPFNRLSATLALQDGIVTTEDLFIDSNAMNLSLVGRIDLPRDELDLLLGVKPLRTVDQIVTHIPIAGWLLAGEEKALITAHFRIRGRSEAPEVSAIPISSLSKQVLGIFQRVLGLPGRMLDEAGELLQPTDPADKPTGRQ